MAEVVLVQCPVLVFTQAQFKHLPLLLHWQQVGMGA